MPLFAVCSLMMDDEEKKEEAKNIVNQAKTAANDGRLHDSMALFSKAYLLYPTEKIKKRMEKLQAFIDSQQSEDDSEEDDEMVVIGKNFSLHKTIANNLYDYQKTGVLWFWKLFQKGSGGILGDDMGLGKTIQVISFLSGMFDADHIKTVLIVAPLAVLVNWEKEFKKWAAGIRLKQFHGAKKQRESDLEKIQRTRGVLLTTYGMVVSNTDLLGGDKCKHSFTWDYIILDEGHKIKNPNKTSKCIRAVPAKYHYICTGTAVQNNLMEMWSLFDFTHQGDLLGTRKTFETEFAKPITRAREKDANAYSQQVGNQMSEQLREIIRPYFLRRTKADIFSADNNPTNDSSNKTEDSQSSCTPQLNCSKRDLIIWVYLESLQLKLYQGLVKSERVKATLLTKRSPLTELNCLKKLCDHPRLQTTLTKLLTSAESQEARLDCNLDEEESTEGEENMYQGIDEAAHAPPVDELVKDSGKMIFLVRLMEELKKGKHRTLIFSQSRKMLDIIQKVLLTHDHKLLRLDGTISNPQDREKIIDKFQTDSSYDVMLMTTQIGSVGLTLTAADRLIIFDPSWNPGTDSQAVDRIYRLGQTKDVVIYRLITCGSIEEKIYRKQIFKNAIMKQTTGGSDNPYRYFTNQQLRELFVLDDPRTSATQMQLEELHTKVNTDEKFQSHLKFLNSESCVYGVSHHDQLFSQEATDDQLVGFEEQIDQQVALATQRVREEVNSMEIPTPKRRNKPSSCDTTRSVNSSVQSDTSETTTARSHQHDSSLQIIDNEDAQLHGPFVIDDEDNDDGINNIEQTMSKVKLVDESDDAGTGSDQSVSVLEDAPAQRGPTLDRVKVSVNDSDHVNESVNNGVRRSLPQPSQEISGSSEGDLYTSCLMEPDERADMAKLNATLGMIKISDSTERRQSKVNEDQEEQNDVNNGSMCLVNDTDTETDEDDDTDVDSSHESEISNCPETPSPARHNVVDSFAKTPLPGTPKRGENDTTSLIQSLGKAYRTPPFSPVDFSHAESIRRAHHLQGRRDSHSTPMDSTRLSFVKTPVRASASKIPENIMEESLIKLSNEYVANDAKDGVDDIVKPIIATLDDSASIHDPHKDSFVYVQDTGCSPIPAQASVDPVSRSPYKAAQTSVHVNKSRDEEDKSFMYVQDMGCSPLVHDGSSHVESLRDQHQVNPVVCKMSESYTEDDTLPVVNDEVKKCESFTDNDNPQKPISKESFSDDTLEDTMPISTSAIQTKSESKSRTDPGVDGESDENSGRVDFLRLEKALETSSSKPLSPRSVLSAISPNVKVRDVRGSGLWHTNDQNLAKTLGHRVRSAPKRDSPHAHRSPVVLISPGKSPEKSPGKSLLGNSTFVTASGGSQIGSGIKDNDAKFDPPMNEEMADIAVVESLNDVGCYNNNSNSNIGSCVKEREVKLKQLCSLMRANMAKTTCDVDVHVLMRIADLVQELGVGLG